MRYKLAVFLLIAGGLLARMVFIGSHPLEGSLYSDMANYVNIAEDIQNGVWHPTHFFQPIGYPLLLSGLRGLGANWLVVLGWVQVAASGLTLFVVWMTSTMAFGRRVGLISLAVSTIHVPWIVYVGFAMPETLFTLCLALLTLSSIRVVSAFRPPDAFVWGAVFFVALLLKGTHIFVVVLLILFLLAWKGAAALRTVAIITVVIWAGLIGHGVLTKSTVGTFQITASAGGLNFVEGKCPIKSNADAAGGTWLSPLYFQLGKTEEKKWDRPFTDSGFFFNEGLACIQANPSVLVQSLEGIPFLFIGNWMWPRGNLVLDDWVRFYEMLFAGYAGVGLCALAALSNRRNMSPSVFVPWVIPVLGLFLCVYIFKSEVRFRIPFDVLIIPLAAKGWTDLMSARIPVGATLPTRDAAL